MRTKERQINFIPPGKACSQASVQVVLRAVFVIFLTLQPTSLQHPALAFFYCYGWVFVSFIQNTTEVQERVISLSRVYICFKIILEHNPCIPFNFITHTPYIQGLGRRKQELRLAPDSQQSSCLMHPQSVGITTSGSCTLFNFNLYSHFLPERYDTMHLCNGTEPY